MNKAMKKRVQQVEAVLASVPVPPQRVKAAFEEFRRTGELPEDRSLAHLVVQRAKVGYDDIYTGHGTLDFAASLRRAVETRPRIEDPLMDQLYDEAVWADGIRQKAARMALRALAAAGFDPSEPQFAGKDMDFPDWGGVGLHFLGFTERLVQPPYEEQARRLFARYDVLRDRVPQGDRGWFDGLAVAIGAFHELGELPQDELVRDAVLADAELRALMRHALGEDVTEVMAALDDVVRSDGDEPGAAVRRLLGMARNGALLAKDAVA